MIKTVKVIPFALILMLAFSTSAFAWSRTYIYPIANIVAQSYAETVETVSYNHIAIHNTMYINGVGYGNNYGNSYNDSDCITPDITTSTYDSAKGYESQSYHEITNGGVRVSETLGNAYISH